MIKYLEFNFINDCVTFQEQTGVWFDLDQKELKEYINDCYEEYDYVNKQLQVYKDKEEKLREELLIWGEVINPTLQNNLLQILNEGDK